MSDNPKSYEVNQRRKLMTTKISGRIFILVSFILLWVFLWINLPNRDSSWTELNVVAIIVVTAISLLATIALTFWALVNIGKADNAK